MLYLHYSSNNPNQAISYLEDFISGAQLDPAQRDIEAKACKQLGVLYSKQRRYDAAVSYFERHFNLINKKYAAAAARTSTNISNPSATNHSNNTKPHSNRGGIQEAITPETREISNVLPETEELRVAVVQLGVAKANAQMHFMFDTVADGKGVSALIDWKNTRTFGSYLPPSHRVNRI